MKRHDYILILISLLMILGVSLNAQPQSNFCDSVAFVTATTIPNQPTGVTFNPANKVLSISNSGNPNGFQIKKIFALKLSGNRGYIEVVYWGGLICSDSFYDFYYGATTAEIERYVRQVYPGRINSNVTAWMRYEVYATNDAYILNSQSIFTPYFQP